MSDDIKPFNVSVPDSSIQLLKNKLAAATFPDEVDFSDDWSYGATLSDVRRLAQYWKDGFDWRAQEERINRMAQFTTTIDVEGFGGLNIHFVHQRSSRSGSIPLLFVHGWPGSFLEVAKVLPLLTEPKDEDAPSFHVVAPSLPNFGFSDAVTKKGFSLAQYAETMHKVMLKLGYDKYVTQGGDWGCFITRLIGLNYPDHCLASHINFIFVKPPIFKSLWLGIKYYLGLLSDSDSKSVSRTGWYARDGSGYMILQSTKPSTLGFAMADSPVALLAWIHEKLHDWTDDYPWTDDEVLTWVSIYQFSSAGPAANLRIYYEVLRIKLEELERTMMYIPKVPLGVSFYPKDVLFPPRSWAKALGPVVFEAVHTEGGHFAAHECPEQFVEDLRTMFGAGGGAHGAVRLFALNPRECDEQ
ncbi:Putative epoxide hydrolase [Cladobotryum mycophilum]|uniref:Epoxide hydrolase n=1 Tax=Cladobotryum mycophilum TaxID=491253 RepID=A0ABR0S9R7_9HYPO